MLRWMAGLVASLAISSTALGHFVFVVPEEGGKAKVIMSETLEPDVIVGAKMLEGVKLSVRDAGGSETELALTKGDSALDTTIGGKGNRVVHGVVSLGVVQRGEGKPHLLLYYPKTVIGDAFDASTVVGEKAAAELVPVGKPGALKLKLLGNGKPQAEAEVIVILPGGTEKKVKTDKDGLTETFAETGRFGAWARFWETKAGERDGKKYEEMRHYATLVADVGTSAPPTRKTATPPAVTTHGAATTPAETGPALPKAVKFATMPEETSSFGAATSDGWLYIYGGHIAPTHSYSTEAVSGKFNRLKLSDGKTWESLPGGTAMQGMNLAAHNGKIYLVGGMEPRNKPEAETDNHSLAACGRFDPATKKWESIASLPVPRSSHDVVVVGDTLYVVGGWTLKGDETTWCDDALAMDLKAEKPEWKSIKQPFKRRALIAVEYAGKLVVIGGFNEESEIVADVSIYDPKSQAWTTGPALPGGEKYAFGPAACVKDGKLYVSLGNGKLYVLDAAAGRWDALAAGTPRIVHRLAATDSQVLIIGGAAKGKNSDLIEAVTVTGTK